MLNDLFNSHEILFSAGKSSFHDEECSASTSHTYFCAGGYAYSVQCSHHGFGEGQGMFITRSFQALI